MRDGEKRGNGEDTGSLVSKSRAQEEAGREGVCSRGQRRLKAVLY